MTVLVPQHVLTDLGRVFLANGQQGCETSAMLLAGSDGRVTGAIVPDQRASRVPHCWVEVTERGKLDLAVALTDGAFYVARIHSHPHEAFHSATDDANPSLCHPGALSIVAPHFGETLRQGLDACAIFRRHDRSWVELRPGPERDRYIRYVPDA